MKPSLLFREDWRPFQRHWPALSMLKQLHRVISFVLTAVLLVYSLLRGTFTWVGAVLVVVGIIVIIDFRATWAPSFRDEILVIVATSSIFFLGTLVEQGVALYYEEAPKTYQLGDLVIGLIVAFLLFARLSCSFLAMEVDRRFQRLLEPASQIAFQVLEMAESHARTMATTDSAEELLREQDHLKDMQTLRWISGLVFLTILLASALAVLLSLLLPFHPQLNEMENTIRPETFLFLLLALAVLTIIFVDLGLKKAFRSVSEKTPSSPPSDQNEARKQNEEILHPMTLENRELIRK
ncbi:MAG: hypothetical protein ACFFB3_07930 [Candidatus Hodarchaeota archaeon]